MIKYSVQCGSFKSVIVAKTPIDAAIESCQFICPATDVLAQSFMVKLSYPDYLYVSAESQWSFNTGEILRKANRLDLNDGSGNDPVFA